LAAAVEKYENALLCVHVWVADGRHRTAANLALLDLLMS
jgi:hypothetical protein